MLITNWCVAQIFVNQKNINATGNQYIEVWEKHNRSSGKFLVMVDYGQDLMSDKEGTSLKMHDAKGSVLQFNSVIAILNFFHLNGWELVSLKNTDEIESYLLKRRNNFVIPELKEAASPSIGSN